MNITRFNLNEKFEEIEKNLQTCSFIAVDAEFSGLPSLNNKNSLFDSTAQRYAKLRNGVEGVVFTQVGISPFHYNREKNAYVSTTYNFYLCPTSVGNINQICTFQSSALDFLTTHKFDFNKIMYEGIPYLNKCEECMLRRDLKTGDLELLLDLEHSELLLSCNAQLSQWLTTAKEGETFELTGSPVLCYLMTTKLKTFFPKLTIQNKGFEVSVINTKESIRGPEDKQNDEDIFVNHCLGFSRIVKVMEKVKKPLVFHNALTDLLIFFHQFLDPLPTRYESFKHSVHQTFPIIYDTKYISNEMKFIVKKERFSESTCLATLYKFFSSSKGLQLALHSPSITMKDIFEVTPQFHEAGFDSYCTGYCFIRLCHWSACQLQGSDHVMSSTEHLNSLKKYCNRINISRAAQLYISLDSEDPPKHRPEFLHVEMFGDRKLNVAQIVCHLSKYGSIDVKKYGQNSALVAVTNKICAQNILAELNKDWKVARYNTLKHSPVARMALWSSFVVSSGSLIAYLIHKMA